jgi:hypothetical protein
MQQNVTPANYRISKCVTTWRGPLLTAVYRSTMTDESLDRAAPGYLAQAWKPSILFVLASRENGIILLDPMPGAG